MIKIEGTVKFYNASKGFGFILGEDGQDYFVHASDLNGEVLNQNDDVEFTPSRNDKGNKASNVSR